MINMPKKCSLSRQVTAYGMQGGQHLHTVIMYHEVSCFMPAGCVMRCHVNTVLQLSQWPARELYLLFISVSEGACRNAGM
jgi:hypothetical protein